MPGAKSRHHDDATAWLDGPPAQIRTLLLDLAGAEGPPLDLDDCIKVIEAKAGFFPEEIGADAVRAARIAARCLLGGVGDARSGSGEDPIARVKDAWRRAMIEVQGRTRGEPTSPEGIEITPGVCGGDARIAGTRIPVWSLESMRRQGASDEQILDEYPGLSPQDMANAWSYVEKHPDEIESLIRDNEVA